ncbi:ABC transporter ATP-binding protein [Arthrobacter koreensis]|jgi:putative ABC transport system ATP-binding protein|uniref:ABC transporter ATP-binding protein n=1 Tax=Arthrobacter koreensis TaxID=199136 RepID=A0ABY6FRN1_9MICC|nr:ABC transporter ATP-binding protein [Arthrobacter koreensis]MDF2497864.1 transporter ATP-binding protein [Arthrobacter koreensis]MEB7446806.1 ABC transporter ATP-binding protein [Arthrobacter koreensis]UYB35873.1 ABC transporter ATP-binding protein [Arthrobacter koreensis]
MNNTTTALVLKDVTLEYPDGQNNTVRALDNVSLSAVRGTVTGLAGPSGSGKSSLLAVAATLIPPTSGTVEVNGSDVGGLDDTGRARLRREEIGIVFQQPNLLPSLTAVEQLVAVAHLRGESTGPAAERAAELLGIVGLGGQASQRPHQLSGGQRQRVNIARALMGNPSLLLVDEPTAALDHERSASIMKLLREVTEEFKVATILVTHDVEFLPLADVVVRMRDGVLTHPAPVDTP